MPRIDLETLAFVEFEIDGGEFVTAATTAGGAEFIARAALIAGVVNDCVTVRDALGNETQTSLTILSVIEGGKK